MPGRLKLLSTYKKKIAGKLIIAVSLYHLKVLIDTSKASKLVGTEFGGRSPCTWFCSFTPHSMYTSNQVHGRSHPVWQTTYLEATGSHSHCASLVTSHQAFAQNERDSVKTINGLGSRREEITSCTRHCSNYHASQRPRSLYCTSCSSIRRSLHPAAPIRFRRRLHPERRHLQPRRSTLLRVYVYVHSSPYPLWWNLRRSYSAFAVIHFEY